MSGGGSGGGSTQTLPPPQLAGAYDAYGSQLEALMGNQSSAFNNYQGQTQANTSPYTQAGISALANPAAFQQAQNYYGDVAGGQYLGLNPAMQGAVMNPAIQATDARFNQLGRFGSPGNAEASQEAAMRALMPYYDNERQRQGQAAAMLPALQQQGAQAQLQAGQLQQGVEQRDINEAMAQFGQQNYDPQLAALQAYGGLLSPGSQYSISQSQPSGGSNLAGALGGGLAGYAAGSALTQNMMMPLSTAAGVPWLGAGLGLLGGLL